MKLLPLDCPELIELVANWLSQQDNYKWLDFGNGVHSPTPISLKVMTQRDLHVLRAFTPDGSDLPIGVVGLSNVDRRFKTAASMWAVLGRKRYGGHRPRAASKLPTLGFTGQGLESVGAWTGRINAAAPRGVGQLGFPSNGRPPRRSLEGGPPPE